MFWRSVSPWWERLLALPMVAGWMLQELIGSWTHLVPSVTPGDPAQHARQRRILAAASRTRLVALNLGVALVWSGGWLAIGPMVAAGAALAGAALVLAIVLLARALVAVRNVTNGPVQLR